MKQLTATLGLVWAIANLLVAYLFVRGSFGAPTPAKEGGAAQFVVLLGGLLLALFAILLIRQCVRLAREQT